MLPLMDKLFGTSYQPKKQWPVKYGIQGAMSPGLFGQLLHPFLPATSSDRAASSRSGGECGECTRRLAVSPNIEGACAIGWATLNRPIPISVD